MNRFETCSGNRSGGALRVLLRLLAGGLLAATYLSATGRTQELPKWTSSLRGDHPRLFFNADTWPQVQARALGAEREWYDQTRARVDRLLEQNQSRESMDAKDYGVEAAWSAFVYRVTRQPQYLELARKCLDASLRYYDTCFAERKSVNWYSTSRIHATLAWDWLFEDLPEATRRDTMERLVRAIDRVLEADPPIYRENLSGYNTGFYGVRNCLWFIGCTAYGTGIASEKVNEWLVWGQNENLKLLEHRQQACGDDGGGASATLGYLMGAYPWSEQNFFYTWLSATGENIAPDWPHSAWLANYAIWHWIESEHGPREFGYGDTDHTKNALPVHQLYTHLANIQHLFGQQRPVEAGLARYLQQRLPVQRYSSSWFVYPFLLTSSERSGEPFSPEQLPAARHFENMGQVIMRSGAAADDTYCLFSCGGKLRQHRHYDALNFVIYHQGFLALDSGTRYKEFDNGSHLANYYAQTVAHNCVVIHQKGEPAASYWGGTVVGNHGGQHRQLGSEVKAFETNDAYVYVAGDATACYQHGQADLGEKCELVTRQIVFLMPRHFVIFDRVVSTDADYRKDWLIHTAQKPSIDAQIICAEHGLGRMLCRTLLPRQAVLRPVGGPGKAYWAAGQNWDLVEDGLTDANRALIGQWRVEVTAEQPQRAEKFLHIIQVGDSQMTHMDAVELVEQGGRHGVRLTTAGQTWEVLFDGEGPLGGSVRRGVNVLGSIVSFLVEYRRRLESPRAPIAQ